MGTIHQFVIGVSTSVLIAAGLALPAASAQAQTPCVRIYYDSSRPEANWYFGRIQAMTLQNLLGHFPQYKQIVEPIENYKTGDLDQCRANFYLGSYFDNAVPFEFLLDYSTTRSNVMWVGYNVWMLGNETMAKALGYTYAGLTTLDREKLDDDKKPGFYKHVLYKGEKFSKFGEWDRNGARDAQGRPVFHAAYEQVLLARPTIKIPNKDPRKPPKEEIDKKAPGQVIAEVEHNVTKKKIPWAVRNGNRFYVADMPFAYMHEGDRYAVFADLLFDVLGEQPRYPGKKPAVLRLEDISSCTDASAMRAMADVLKDKKVPFHLALIPIFANPRGEADECVEDFYTPMTTRPDFQALVRDMQAAGASIIWHGVTHQYTDPVDPRGPNSGYSGDDFEFWNETTRTPLVEDSTSWFMNRLELGWQELERSGLRPQIWEFPHYEGSALNYHMVSRLFSWHIGRFAYTISEMSGKPAEDPSIWFEVSGSKGAAARMAAFRDLKVEYGPVKPFNMMYPYESYGDVYGQKNLPENLNYVTHWTTKPSKVYGEWTIGNMMETLKRNRVLRDQWASLFIHPYHLIGDKKDKGPLKKIIEEVRDSGYEFVNLEQFIADKKQVARAPIIERSREDGSDRWQSRASRGGALMSRFRASGPATLAVEKPAHEWPAVGLAHEVSCGLKH